MIPLAFAAVFVAGRSALDESEPALIEEASTQIFEPTIEPTEEAREAVLDSTPEPDPSTTPAGPASTASEPTAPAAEHSITPEATALPAVEAVAPPRSEIPADRTSCAAIVGSDYRSSTERSWYLANCGRATHTAPAVARTLATPARSTVVKPTVTPQPPRDLHSVSTKLCGSSIVRYPAFSDGGIVYGACTSSAASAIYALPRLTCADGYVLIPSAVNPGAVYCYDTPSKAR